MFGDRYDGALLNRSEQKHAAISLVGYRIIDYR